MEFNFLSYLVGVAVGAISVGIVWLCFTLFPTDCDELP